LAENMKINLPYIQRDRMRDGSWRYRFRRGATRKTLPGKPNSPEFMAAYDALLNGTTPASNAPLTLAETRGTVRWLIELYTRHMASAVKAGTMSPLTHKQRANILGRFALEHGHRDALHIPTRAIRIIINKGAAKPGATNNLLKSLRAMFKWAVDTGLCDTDPTAGLRKIPTNSSGFIAWDATDLAKFQQTHPRGTTANLALMILIFTACRRSDLVKLGRQHITEIDGLKCLSFTQAKGGNNERQRVTIPILPPLYRAITSPPAGEMTFLMSAQGKPFSTAGFGMRFKKWCLQAGLENRSAHGIRKAAGALLANAGCTQHEIMAIHGHADARTSDIYTRTADRLTLAKSAMDKFAKIEWGT